jgi:hypothetical protein
MGRVYRGAGQVSIAAVQRFHEPASLPTEVKAVVAMFGRPGDPQPLQGHARMGGLINSGQFLSTSGEGSSSTSEASAAMVMASVR